MISSGGNSGSILLCCALLAISATSVLAADLSPALTTKLNSLYDGLGNYSKMKAAADSLTPTERTEIISYIKDEVRRDGHDALEANVDVLVNVGDDETIAQEAQAFPYDEPTGGGSFLFWTIQPKVVPAMASNLFINEDYTIGDPLHYPKSFFTAELIREILERSPYFPSTVNRWAASWVGKGGDPPIAFRAMMRNWWNANKQYFGSGNYAAVQPGPPAPWTPPRPPVVSVLTPSPAALSAPLPQGTPTAPPLTPTPSPTPVPLGESNRLLISALALLAFLAAAFLISLRRS
jgi:hypothetical protein